MMLPLTVLLATLIAASPLLGIVILIRLPWPKQSAWLSAAATFGIGLMGCATTMMAVFTCAGGLARAMSGDGPKCVTGAAIFLPIGALFTFVAFLVGLVFTLRRIGNSEVSLYR